MSDTGKIRLIVEPDVCAALGKSAEELSVMSLGQFYELVYYHGLDVRVSGFNVKSVHGDLRIRMDEKRPIAQITQKAST